MHATSWFCKAAVGGMSVVMVQLGCGSSPPSPARARAPRSAPAVVPAPARLADVCGEVVRFPSEPTACDKLALAFSPDGRELAISHPAKDRRLALSVLALDGGGVSRSKEVESESVDSLMWSGEFLLLLGSYNYEILEAASLATRCSLVTRYDDPALDSGFGLGLEYEPPFALSEGQAGAAEPRHLDPQACKLGPRLPTASERLVARMRDSEQWTNRMTTPDRKYLLVTHDDAGETWSLDSGKKVSEWENDLTLLELREPVSGKSAFRVPVDELRNQAVSLGRDYLAGQRGDDRGCWVEITHMASCKLR